MKSLPWRMTEMPSVARSQGIGADTTSAMLSSSMMRRGSSAPPPGRTGTTKCVGDCACYADHSRKESVRARSVRAILIAGAHHGRRRQALPIDEGAPLGAPGWHQDMASRVLEELGYWWFEEPVQHYHVKAMGEVSRRLDITVSAGERTYSLSGLADLIEAGVRIVQPDIVKMGGFTGMWRCAAVVEAHGVELVPHQTQPTIGHTANHPSCGKPAAYDKALRVERHDATPALGLRKSPKPADGLFHLPTGPGLGLQINEAELAKRRVPIA
jgi:Enolase C-terminal domain-like